MGYEWEPQPKFMNVSRGEPFDCGAKCMLGCRCGAKWTANEYVDEAVQAGCELLTGMNVKEVLVNNGKAEGVVATVSGGQGVLRVEAPTVILAAGGIGSPIILQHSGLSEAGRGMTMDTTVMVCGESRDEGMHLDPPMAVSYCDDKNGYMLSTLIDPWLLYPLIHTWHGPRNPLRFLRYGKTLGVMIKLKDEISGGISVEGKISKSLTEQDRWRLNHASNVARKILIRAGCKPDSVFVGPLRGTHPSGTVRIGELLSTQLESPVKGLYVSDASCFPEALDRPTVLTLIALSKRLAKHLLSKDKPKARPEGQDQERDPEDDAEEERGRQARNHTAIRRFPRRRVAALLQMRSHANLDDPLDLQREDAFRLHSRIFIGVAPPPDRRNAQALDEGPGGGPDHHRDLLPGRAALHPEIPLGARDGPVRSTFPRAQEGLDSHLPDCARRGALLPRRDESFDPSVVRGPGRLLRCLLQREPGHRDRCIPS